MRRMLWLTFIAVASAGAGAPGAEQGGPTPEEQYLVQLINRARNNPAGEAGGQGVALNEGLPQGTISDKPKQPLAINEKLMAAAREHTHWMLKTSQIQHEGAGGSQPMQRMEQAGYRFDPPAGGAENLGFKGTTGDLENPAMAVEELHRGLFVDENVEHRGHRTNLMMPEMREIGIGVMSGTVRQEGHEFNSWLATEDLAYCKGNAFVTGVVYSDHIKPDHFYTPGEGKGDVTITVTRSADRKRFTTKTWPSGGYTLQLAPGTYQVSISGAGVPAQAPPKTVTIKAENVAADFELP